ncbi:hypothetical protein Vadar_001730 [Vaccinium darrowii]|uniref:Uncharacterized protein n=1 Tax=Vaccinium darrowii TaxID=229202 RepID=A0ACB7WX35_9ERIC|nr:hypothetical protein Vadar_001730 [Vaccinium darrowii]
MDGLLSTFPASEHTRTQVLKKTPLCTYGAENWSRKLEWRKRLSGNISYTEFTPRAAAVCINVGTLTAEWLPTMRAAAVAAGRADKPWVLDPVAAGASGFRLKACLELVGLRPTVVRGNGSEIIALCNASVGASKGLLGHVSRLKCFN